MRGSLCFVLFAAWLVQGFDPLHIIHDYLNDDVSNEAEMFHSVLWMAPFYSGGGYASEAITYVSSLAALSAERAKCQGEGCASLPSQKWDVAIGHHGDSHNYDFVAGLPENTRGLLTHLEGAHVRDPHGSVIICHSEPGAWTVTKRGALYWTRPCPRLGYGRRIGRTMFETDRIPSGWPERLAEMDEIWVPTRFHEEIFRNAGVDPEKIQVVPESVDVDEFNPELYTPLPLEGPADDFKFLSVFKWEKRKGWDVLLESYFGSFTSDDKVALYLLTRAFHSAENFKEQIEEFARQRGFSEEALAKLPRVYVVTNIPQTDMPRLYKACDAFVLPSRGEGWGRPHCEAMAMALPVLATNWSGSTEFMNERNSYPIPINGLVTIGEGAFATHMWADPSVDALRGLMRRVVENPEEARAIGQVARHDMVTKYSPSVVAQGLAARFDAIFARLRADHEQRVPEHVRLHKKNLREAEEAGVSVTETPRIAHAAKDWDQYVWEGNKQVYVAKHDDSEV